MTGEEEWDGAERRTNPPTDVGEQVVAAFHRVTNHQDSAATLFQQRAVLGLLVGVSIAVAMNLVILISQYRLAAEQKKAQDAQRMFRQSLGCLVVETVGVEPARDVLTKCGFIRAPGN